MKEFHDSSSHDNFLRWFTKSEPALRRFTRSLVPSITDADDVLQEVAVTLWQKFSEFEGDSSEDFRRWAFGVTKFKVLSWKRDQGRDRHLFSSNLLERIAEKSCLQADRLTAQQEALQLCLEQLPKKQRSIVDAAYAPNARIDQLAKTLGRSAMSIYKQLHRTRIALKECVLLHLKSAGWEV